MPKINVRQKGYRAEKLFRDKVFYNLGIKLKPTVLGSSGCDATLGDFKIEIKNQKTIKFKEWLRQAKEQAKDNNWLLAIKMQGKDKFTITMDEDLFFLLIREEVVG